MVNKFNSNAYLSLYLCFILSSNGTVSKSSKIVIRTKN
jgi:hypothetical protein